MISFDTNILMTALESRLPGHKEARAFVESLQGNESAVICELMLVELFTLLRNPKVCSRPLSHREAAGVIHAFRRHPTWRLVDYEPTLADDLWAKAETLPSRLQIYDARLALTLRHHGVTEFATGNVKDFQDFGFQRVWDPIHGHP